MKKILLTEKETSFPLYFHALLKVIILDGCFWRFLNCTKVPNRSMHHIKLTASGKFILAKVLE